MFDVITFGSATSDTFLRLKEENYKIFQGEQEGLSRIRNLCFRLGAKVFIDELKIESGGGGTNAACTFALQGFKTAYCGNVGKDKEGEAVLEDLKQNKVDTTLCKKDSEYPTAFSAVLSVPGQERTVLIYRGACHFIKFEELNLKKIKQAKWFYLAPLSGRSSEMFGQLVRFGKENNIKVACNLSNTQINLSEQILEPLLKVIDVLILNKEEANLLLKNKAEDEKQILLKLADLTKAAIVITKSSDGSIVFANNIIFKATAPMVESVEKTGAGDAYGSAFVAGLLKKNDVEYAIKLASANATSCILQIGAKKGLLKKGEQGRFSEVRVFKENIII